MLHKIQLCILYKWQEMVRLRQTTKHLVQLQQWCSHQNPPQRLQYSWRFPEFDRWSCYGIQIRRSLTGQSPIHTGGRRICIPPQALQVADWFSMEEHIQSRSQCMLWSSIAYACVLFRHFIWKKIEVDHVSVQSSPVQSTDCTHPSTSLIPRLLAGG